jgi:quercetin dioxygenase-like cupin family protein
VAEASQLAVVWDRFEEIPPFSPAANIWMRSIAGNQLMLNMVTIEPGGIVPDHSHANEQAGYVVRGTLILTIEGETRHLKPGDCYLAPANVVHSGATTDEGCDVLDVFAPPRPDYVEAAANARRVPHDS